MVRVLFGGEKVDFASDVMPGGRPPRSDWVKRALFPAAGNPGVFRSGLPGLGSDGLDAGLRSVGLATRLMGFGPTV